MPSRKAAFARNLAGIDVRACALLVALADEIQRAVGGRGRSNGCCKRLDGKDEQRAAADPE